VFGNSNDSDQLWHNVSKHQCQLMKSLGEIEELGGRMVEIVMRISLIAALSIDLLAQNICEQAVKWAVDYTKYGLRRYSVLGDWELIRKPICRNSKPSFCSVSLLLKTITPL
jgi:hypothetical protein